MSISNSMLVVLTVAGLTFLTRYLPFALFSNMTRPSLLLTDLGRILPPAVIAILVIYCLKTVEFHQAQQFLPQMVAVAVVVVLHLWKKNTLISIGLGTACYMLMVQLVWK
jgi:branched-subunit amino acid transport protein AzlD